MLPERGEAGREGLSWTEPGKLQAPPMGPAPAREWRDPRRTARLLSRPTTGRAGCAAGDQQEAGGSGVPRLPPTPEASLPPCHAPGTRCALGALPAGSGPLPGSRAPRSPPRHAASCQPRPLRPRSPRLGGAGDTEAGPGLGPGGRAPAPGQHGVTGSLGVTHLGPSLGRGGSSDTWVHPEEAR